MGWRQVRITKLWNSITIFFKKLIERRLKVQEDDNRGGGRLWRREMGGAGVLRCSDVTARRAADRWWRKPRQRRGDATKALITADAAFTRSRRIKWIYWTPAWGNSEGFIPFFLSSASAGNQLVSKKRTPCLSGCWISAQGFGQTVGWHPAFSRGHTRVSVKDDWD